MCHLEKLTDLACAHEHANNFHVLSTLQEPVELWNSTFNCKINSCCKVKHWRVLEVTGQLCFGGDEQTKESWAARLAGNQQQYNAMSCRAGALLRRDK